MRAPDVGSMFMKPSLFGLKEIRTGQVITVGMDGEQRTFGGTMHHEVFIHSEIYKARPDLPVRRARVRSMKAENRFRYFRPSPT